MMVSSTKRRKEKQSMLYPENEKPVLADELFRHPGSEYRAAPFWAWNCKLDRDELMRQLDILKEMGMGGAHMHVRTGMATPYLSEEFMKLIQSCVEKCRQEGMLAWLYDEDRWPSGAAGGLVTREEKYRARHLLFTAKPYGELHGEETSREMSGNPSRSEGGKLLACYDVVLDENGCLARALPIGPEESAQGRKWYAYVEADLPNPWYNHQTYVNTLDKAAIRRFLEVTHQRYLEAVGKDFGGLIPAIFTDEPQFSRKGCLGFAAEAGEVILPWSDDVPETFRQAWGEDLLASLPELIWELPDGRVSLVRYHYHDHIAERFASAFADQCGAWCAAHGLMLTGHMMEEPTLLSQTAALGEAMRSYRSFQLPGIDMLCGWWEFTTAKQAQSAVHQYGRPGMLSELYGVTGWTFDFRGHKLHGDWQAALGVTVRVPHLSWVSMKGEAKRDYPASINYQSPWWKDYALVEDHFARVNAAMTRGKPLVRVGVIHPVESYWLHWGPEEQTHGVRQQLEEQFQNVTRWLLLGGVDFDFISESLLPAQCPQGSAPLRVGEMAYDAIVVPGCETLRGSTLERLEAFQAAGGLLIFLGSAPRLEDARPSKRGEALYVASQRVPFAREALLEALASVRMVDIRNSNGARADNLLHQLRRDGDGLWLFLAHGGLPYNPDVATRQEIAVTLPGCYAVRIYDTQTGGIRPADFQHQGGRTVIRAALYDYDSLLLRLDHTDVSPARRSASGAAWEALPVPERTPYTLSEPNALLLDVAEYALDQAPYHPAMELLRADNALRRELGWPSREGAVAQPWSVPEEIAVHSVRLRFTIHAACPVASPRLALEDAGAAKVSLNGAAVSAAPNGWFVDKCIGVLPLPPLHEGENLLEVVLPFSRRDGLEWCYLLGDFGVTLQGSHRCLVPRTEALGFDDVTRQGLPHYSGNVTWRIPVETRGGRLRVTAPHYAGAAIRVSLDGQDAGYIVYPPYRLTLEAAPGKHELALTVLGHRENAFGPLHKADDADVWIGPNAWRTTGDRWTDSYRVAPLGLRSAPLVEEER